MPTDTATLAYQLWLGRGGPIGSDQEDWFRSEATLKSAGAVTGEELFKRVSVPCCDTCTESEMPAEFLWDGHWEVWEREWVTARWVWDVRALRAGVTNRARRSGEPA